MYLNIKVTFQPSSIDSSELTKLNHDTIKRLQDAIESLIRFNAHVGKYLDEVIITEVKENK